MKFQLLPVIDIMMELYQSPLNSDRFTQYMKILQGNSPGDITMPVTFFNPMGKEHVLKKLQELKDRNAEKQMEETLTVINRKITSFSSKTIQVALALADDLGGGWTNRYTTDYDSKFNIHDLMKRDFCNPVFWVSEEFPAEKISARTAEYCYRMVYRSATPQPTTLEEHIQQELFVAEHNPFPSSDISLKDGDKTQSFYSQFKSSTQFPTIFNFLYGDAASKEIGHSIYGIREAFAGYAYAKELAGKAEKV